MTWWPHASVTIPVRRDPAEGSDVGVGKASRHSGRTELIGAWWWATWRFVPFCVSGKSCDNSGKSTSVWQWGSRARGTRQRMGAWRLWGAVLGTSRLPCSENSKPGLSASNSFAHLAQSMDWAGSARLGGPCLSAAPHLARTWRVPGSQGFGDVACRVTCQDPGLVALGSRKETEGNLATVTHAQVTWAVSTHRFHCGFGAI